MSKAQSKHSKYEGRIQTTTEQDTKKEIKMKKEKEKKEEGEGGWKRKVCSLFFM
jgi:hypothetical protein